MKLILLAGLLAGCLVGCDSQLRKAEKDIWYARQCLSLCRDAGASSVAKSNFETLTCECK